MKHFAKIVYGFKPLTNLVKTFVLDLRLGSENASEIPSALISPYENFLKSDEPSFSSYFFIFNTISIFTRLKVCCDKSNDRWRHILGRVNYGHFGISLFLYISVYVYPLYFSFNATKTVLRPSFSWAVKNKGEHDLSMNSRNIDYR